MVRKPANLSDEESRIEQEVEELVDPHVAPDDPAPAGMVDPSVWNELQVPVHGFGIKLVLPDFT